MQVSDIKQDMIAGEFFVEDGNLKAFVKYHLQQQGEKIVCDLNSTYVPTEWRSRGLAELLVRKAISWAKEQNYDLQASCWYAAKFIRQV